MTATKYLQQLFKKYNPSVNGLGRIAKINGGIISQYKSGKREIKDFDTLVRIAKAMGVSDKEYTRLCDLYFAEMYSSAELEAVKTVIAEMPNVMKDASPFPVKKSADTPTDGCLANKEQIDSAIVTLCENAVGNIYTNIPFTDAALDDFFFALLQKENINLIRFFEEEETPDADSIRALMRTLRFFRHQSFPYIVAKPHSVDSTDIFPYFIIAENGYVLCNDSFGIISSDKQSIRKVVEKAENIRASAMQFGRKLESILECVSFGAPEKNKTVEMGCVGIYPCVGTYLSKEDMAASGNDVPNAEALVDFCYAHYSSCNNIYGKTYYTTQKGILDFAKTGNFYNIPPVFVHGLPAKNRRDVLDRIYSEIENDRLYIINTDVLSIPDGIHMDYEGAQVALTAFDSTVEQFCISDIYYRTNSPYYLKLAKLLLQYLKNDRYTYDKQSALHMVGCAKKLAV